jgi:hypothetical protein
MPGLDRWAQLESWGKAVVYSFEVHPSDSISFSALPGDCYALTASVVLCCWCCCTYSALF